MGDSWTSPPINQPLLLFCYLAVQEDWVGRDQLLTLFWPQSGQAKARQSLRSLLYKCKQEPWGEGLEVEEERIRCLAITDVGRFQEEVAAGNWQQAAKQYQGTFLERVKADDSPHFEDWLSSTRDALHAAWRDAVLHLASSSNGSQLNQIIGLLQSVLAYDLLAEDVVQACMRAQALVGQKAAALGTFETFRKQLGEELEVEPLETTLALAEAIRSDAFAGKKVQPTKPTPTLPQPQSPFIGRTLELLELSNLLAEPNNRLITLLGPGGMGKTRLALQLLKEQPGYFEDGVVFVGLAHLSSARDIPDTVASALGLELSGGTSVAQEVFEYLKDKQMLVALDNFDHLLEGVPFVGQLLAAVPGCKFVCTSRALLGAPGEVVYDVFGLTVPTSSLETNLEAYDAAQLFLRSARRIRSDFSLDRSDYPALFELCKTLDGMPLALELAATWVRLFSLKELLGEIRQDMDLLETDTQQFSERHQSLRKVFEYSWQLLNTEEQRALAALSVFHDGFTRQAAQTVAQVSAKTLLALVNKSFIRAGPSGRFGMLEVLRQYAAERLGEAEFYRQQHGVYYLNFLATVRPELSGSSPTTVLSQLEQDLENLRSAWQWALGAGRFEMCALVVEPLRVFLMAKARVQEGIAFFEQALKHLDHRPEPGLLTSIHIELAYFYRRLDQYKESTRHAGQALTLARSIPDDSLTARALYERAFIATRVGRFVESARDAEQALELAKGLQDLELEVRTSSLLALAKRYLGQFTEAEQLYRFVLAQERQMGQQISVLRTLSDLGRLLVDLKRPLEARALFSEGLELAETYNIPYELGFMWEGLSQCSHLLGDYLLAQQQAETALRHSEEVGDIIGVAVQSIYLGKIHLALENLEQAQAYLKQALKIAWDHSEMPEVMKILVVWGKLLLHQRPGQAAELLAQVITNPGAEYVSQQEARQLLGSLNLSASEPQQPLATVVAGLLSQRP